MNKIIFIKKLYNLSFSKYLPGFLRKMMLKKNNITFIPTKLKALPNNNYLTRDTFRLQENLISEYKNSNHISFNSYLDLKKTLREKFNTEAQFNFLDFGGEKIDLFLDITKEFKNIKYFLINQPQINKTLSLIKSKYDYKNLNILNDLSEINKNKYDFVFFGSTIQYLNNYEETLSIILPLTSKYLLFSATHFFSSNEFLKDLVVKQLNYLPQTYFFYFLNIENIRNIFKKHNFKEEFNLLNKSYPTSYSTFDDLEIYNIKYSDILFSKDFKNNYKS